IERDEAEARVVAEARHRREVADAGLAMPGGIALLAGLALQPAVAAAHPAVVEALEHPGVAALLAAHGRAAVRPGVEERVQLALPGGCEQDVAPRDRPGDEVARLRELGLVAQVEPAAVEELLVFALHHAAVDEGVARNLEDPALGVGADHLPLRRAD